jgi:hypothetical protein
MRARLGWASIAALAVLGCKDTVEPLDLAGPPVSLTVAAGDNQRGATGTALASPLTVTVVDASGRPSPGVVVAWEVSGGALSQAVDTTDNSGQAAVSWTLPATAGVFTARAASEGVGDVLFTATAQPIAGDIVFRYLDAGSYHACGITTTEQLLCWGYNADGQLGIAASEPQPFPELIPTIERYRLVSGGRYHGCAITLAGEATCWGDNRDSKASPPTVPSFRAVSSGRVHTCGLTLASELLCWGWDGEGQTDAGGFGWSSVNVNGLHSCGITTAGEADCWGFNESGQLGRNATSVQELPGPVAGGIVWRTDPTVVPPAPDPDFPLPPGPFIGTGFAHSCALRNDGTAFCWGSNQEGQLGDGTTTARLVPTAVAGGNTFSRLTTGDRHSCALTAAGAAFCWGDNTFGQLGDGTTSDKLAPTAVTGGLVFAYLKAGELSTCGVTSTGTAYCWGDNEYGQLGDGSTTASSVPVKVAFQP